MVKKLEETTKENGRTQGKQKRLLRSRATTCSTPLLPLNTGVPDLGLRLH